MREIQCDVAVVGAGTAGLNARREVERAGKSWVLIEGGPFGTTCARVGCMPSKLLISAAEAAHAAHHAGQFGIHIDPDAIRVDDRKVMERVRSERDRFAGFVIEATEALPPDKVVRGWARFEAPGILRVGDHTRVTASSVVLAPGSYPWVPPPFDSIADRVMVNDDVFELERLPESLAVVGTGIIALELGQALHRLGVRTAFFSPFDLVGPTSDPVVTRKVHQVFGAELDLRLSSPVEKVSAEDDGVHLVWRNPDGTTGEDTFREVLAAAGRPPNLRRLGLENAGIPLDDAGRPRDWDPGTTQCADQPVFLAGDASAHRPLLHEAADEGRLAGANAAAFPEVTAYLRRAPLAVMFTDPQVAVVGERFCDLEPDRFAVGEVSFEDQGRSRVLGKNQGVARLYADRNTQQLIGAEMFGPRVEHLSHLLAWAVQEQLQAGDVLSLPFYHPVIEEGLRTALRNLCVALRVDGGCPPENRAEGPGE